MVKKSKSRLVHKKVNKNRRLNVGKISIGMVGVLLFVFLLSIAISGIGNRKFTQYKQAGSQTSTCCDSGNGENCKPIASTSFVIKQNGIDTEYQLLKSNTMLTERQGHLNPISPALYVSGVPANQYVYSSDTEKTDNWEKYIDFCFAEVTKAPPMDSIFAETPNYPSYECQWIPNDQLLYLCRQGCEVNQEVGDEAVFDIYYRATDLSTSGIPDAIKNCPKTSVVAGGKQEIINLPSPSGKPNLQLETFYIQNSNPTSEWVSPFCKPAVYLYPEKTSSINVKINPLGKLLITTPIYPGSGWEVLAYPNGDLLIDNKKYDYLFYESAIPDDEIVLADSGYVVEYNELPVFIPRLVKKLGLNKKETKQFTQYWLSVLPKENYYQIKIVENKVLNRLSPLSINPSPKTIIRVALHFTPLVEKIDLAEPELVTPLRSGFTVSEWGGIFKVDKEHPFSCLM